MKPQTLTSLALIALSCALASLASAQSQLNDDSNSQYRVFNLGVPLGGSVSSDNGVNDLGLSAGVSNLTGDQTAHAVLWILSLPLDLGTLGGPNSAVLWPGINNLGEVVGVSDTDEIDPYGETWSCAAFLPPSHVGHTCVGFKWQFGQMKALPTLGGNNGFATAVNARGQIVGWAENTIHDPTCVAPQVLQFEAVVWGPGDNQIQQLPPYGSDPDSAATGINNRGQVVGISGICQNAVGNQSAAHALLWNNGVPRDLGNLGGTAWNTPMAINNSGIIVGFSDLIGDQGGSNPNFHAFRWVRPGPMQDLGTLPGDAISEALGVNAQGQIVGVSYAAGFANPRAFIYEHGSMVDLNTLTLPNSPEYLVVGGDINDEGVIVGQGCLPAACAAGTSFVSYVAIPTGDGRYRVSVTGSPSKQTAFRSAGAPLTLQR
jgi:probable HAF family extracellular repeat protein